MLPDTASGGDTGSLLWAGQKDVTAQVGGACAAASKLLWRRTFLQPGTNFIEHYACRLY